MKNHWVPDCPGIPRRSVMGEKSAAVSETGRPCRANSAVPTLSGPYSNSVANTSEGPMTVTAPLPKSPMSSGMGKVANWPTG